MIKNYFKIAFRGFWKHKLFTLINIIGLSIGISASVVIYLIVHHEFTFDKFHRDSDRIYRVVSNFTYQDQKNYNRGVSGPVASAVKTQCTGVEFTAPVFTIFPDAFIEGKKGVPVKFKSLDRVAFTDPQFFQIFDYTWVAGSPKTSLQEPNTVVLTTDQAKLYFPNTPFSQMIGKVVTYDTLKTTLTGIVQTITQNTDLDIHDFISFSTVNAHADLSDMAGLTKWGNTTSASILFIKLLPKTAASKVQNQINAILAKASPPDPNDKGKSTRSFALQKLADLHFDNVYGTFDYSNGANMKTLYGLLLIAAFLLLLACINFVNLTTAQATQRAKEIGIRKAMGSSRGQLMVQFLSETFAITLLAMIISVALAPLILKLFSDFIAPGVKADFIHQPSIVLFLFLLTLTVSLLSGFYPAILLSGYKPIEVLKNQVQRPGSRTRNAWLRKSLTVSQFVIAQVFIMGTVLVSKQIYYALHKDLGFKKDAIVEINSPYKNRHEKLNRVLLNKINAIPQVAMTSLGADAPASGGTSTTRATYTNGKKEIESDVELKYGDENYIKLYQIKLLAGRNLTQADTLHAGLINDAYARLLGFRKPEEAIGKQLSNLDGDHKMIIVGVMGDFAERSVQSTINALVLQFPNRDFQSGVLHIALKPETSTGNEWKTAITAMGKAWKDVFPQQDFDYHFYDETIAQFYDSERHMSTLLTWAMSLSILISCMGLLGPAIYTTTQRTKEIGVRKVLGATVTQIVTMLSKEMVFLILLAFIIATPLAWWPLNNWMANYADRTTMSWWIFAGSGAVMLLAALCTSCIQTIKAAITNPVRSLRSE